MADIYAGLRDPDNDELRFSYRDPSVYVDYCALDGQIGIENY